MTILQVLIAALIGYLFGCIQTAYLLSKTVGGFDIRQSGTGNAGASNVTVQMGWSYGIITATLDVLKGIAPVLIIKAFIKHRDNIQRIRNHEEVRISEALKM